MRKSVTLRQGRRAGYFQFGVIQVHRTQLHRGPLRTNIRSRYLEINDVVSHEYMLQHQLLKLAVGIATPLRTYQKCKTDGNAVGASLERELDKERSNVTGNDGAIAVGKGTDYFPSNGWLCGFRSLAALPERQLLADSSLQPMSALGCTLRYDERARGVTMKTPC